MTTCFSKENRKAAPHALDAAFQDVLLKTLACASKGHSPAWFLNHIDFTLNFNVRWEFRIYPGPGSFPAMESFYHVISCIYIFGGVPSFEVSPLFKNYFTRTEHPCQLDFRKTSLASEMSTTFINSASKAARIWKSEGAHIHRSSVLLQAISSTSITNPGSQP